MRVLIDDNAEWHVKRMSKSYCGTTNVSLRCWLVVVGMLKYHVNCCDAVSRREPCILNLNIIVHCEITVKLILKLKHMTKDEATRTRWHNIHLTFEIFLHELHNVNNFTAQGFRCFMMD